MEHLPECSAKPCDCRMRSTMCRCADCICDRLRACEQRVLDSAREAVAALQIGVLTTGTLLLKREDALAAIDALREKR